jgi:hypothetical protein
MCQKASGVDQRYHQKRVFEEMAEAENHKGQEEARNTLELYYRSQGHFEEWLDYPPMLHYWVRENNYLPYFY